MSPGDKEFFSFIVILWDCVVSRPGVDRNMTVLGRAQGCRQISYPTDGHPVHNVGSARG